MSYLWAQIVNGLMLGCMYGLIAVGFSLVYGVARLMNFAHGEFFMAGAFGALFTAELPLWKWSGGAGATVFGTLALSALAGAASGAVVSVLVERLAYRRVRRVSRTATFLVAVGASILLQQIGFKVFTASPRGFPDVCIPDPAAVPLISWLEPSAGLPCNALATPPLRAMALSPSGTSAVTFVVLALAISGAFFFVLRTDTGLAIRAVSIDEKSARSIGIRPQPAIVMTFAVGGALAGIAGFLWSLRYGGVQPLMGFIPGVKAFVAAVIGGVGSVTGAVLGGLLLGLLETLSFAYLPGEVSGYKDALALLLLLVFLLIRPHGLLGRKLGEAA
ncbi:MAG: branched-chain amino acid transport system permease protein [Acidobacteriota bacterium]|jgi:branched-chain amino acid transport system permease protein|nr:branched-chain amino acid transport system permease protein [Acidobacteriota bacterium]